MNPNLVETLYDIADGLEDAVVQTPHLASLLTGTASKETLANWSAQTYRYVHETVPALLLAAEQLEKSGRYPEIAALLARKATEEQNHDEWLLADRKAAGFPARPEDLPPPSPAVVAYIRFNQAMILSGSPVAYLGTSFVLERLSERLAGVAAERLVACGAASADAVGFLEGHADADPHHAAELADVLASIDDPEDANAVRLCAEVTAALYPRFFCSPQ